MKAAVLAAGLACAAAALGALQISGADERAEICRPGFAAYQRPSTEAWERLRRAVFAREGVSWSRRAEFQTDHIVPRCLGGSNDLDNLQLQLWQEAQIKDLREAKACRAYCSGKLELGAARALVR